MSWLRLQWDIGEWNFSCDFSVCSLTCFNGVLFHWKIAIKDEPEVADNSSKLKIGRPIAERDCLWVLQSRVDDDDEKQIASVLSLFSFSLFSSCHSQICLTQSGSEHFVTNRAFFGEACKWCCIQNEQCRAQDRTSRNTDVQGRFCWVLVVYEDRLFPVRKIRSKLVQGCTTNAKVMACISVHGSSGVRVTCTRL